jgi:hypothetical protein
MLTKAFFPTKAIIQPRLPLDGQYGKRECDRPGAKHLQEVADRKKNWDRKMLDLSRLAISVGQKHIFFLQVLGGGINRRREGFPAHHQPGSAQLLRPLSFRPAWGFERVFIKTSIFWPPTGHRMDIICLA